MTSAAASVDAESESYGMLLQGCADLYSAEPFMSGTVRAAFERAASGGEEGEQLVFDGISGLMPNARPGSLSSQSINAIFKHRAGRIVGGLKVEAIKQYGAAANRGTYWRVVKVAP